MQNHFVFLFCNKRKFKENHNGSVCLSDLASWHLLSIRRRHFRFCEQNILSKLVQCNVILKSLLSIWWAQLFSGSNAGSCWFCQIPFVRFSLLGAKWLRKLFLSIFLYQNRKFQFLDAPSHLYRRLCPSVRPSVGPSVGPSVRPSVRPSRVIFEDEKNAY